MHHRDFGPDPEYEILSNANAERVAPVVFEVSQLPLRIVHIMFGANLFDRLVLLVLPLLLTACGGGGNTESEPQYPKTGWYQPPLASDDMVEAPISASSVVLLHETARDRLINVLPVTDGPYAIWPVFGQRSASDPNSPVVATHLFVLDQTRRALLRVSLAAEGSRPMGSTLYASDELCPLGRVAQSRSLPTDAVLLIQKRGPDKLCGTADDSSVAVGINGRITEVSIDGEVLVELNRYLPGDRGGWLIRRAGATSDDIVQVNTGAPNTATATWTIAHGAKLLDISQNVALFDRGATGSSAAGFTRINLATKQIDVLTTTLGILGPGSTPLTFSGATSTEFRFVGTEALPSGQWRRVLVKLPHDGTIGAIVASLPPFSAAEEDPNGSIPLGDGAAPDYLGVSHPFFASAYIADENSGLLVAQPELTGQRAIAAANESLVFSRFSVDPKIGSDISAVFKRVPVKLTETFMLHALAINRETRSETRTVEYGYGAIRVSGLTGRESLYSFDPYKSSLSLYADDAAVAAAAKLKSLSSPIVPRMLLTGSIGLLEVSGPNASTGQENTVMLSFDMAKPNSWTTIQKD